MSNAEQGASFKELAEDTTETFQELATTMKDAPIAPAHGIAAIALNMSMKYNDTQMVKDGALYQQYKLEGKNFRPLTLDQVFEDAIRIEAWLLGASDRIAKLIVDAIAIKVDDDEPADQEEVASDQITENE